MLPCSLVCPLSAARVLIAITAVLVLAGCATAPRRSSDSPSLRCVNEPGRGQSADSSRPLFFIFCAQSP